MDMNVHRILFSILLLASILMPVDIVAQSEFGSFQTGHKGEMFFSWGWNRASYSRSNIHFTGRDYDFTLSKVEGFDRQTDFGIDPYFNPEAITIPQTNFRIGYFISDHYNVTFAVDHMKYVMAQNQTVKINGYIELEESSFNDTYNDEDIVLTEDFLTFEHTDGLNYVNVGLARFDDLWRVEKLRMTVGLTEGASFGLLYPKSNTKLLGKERYDQFHVAGYGLDLRAGLNLNFFKYVFLQAELKGGFINMPDIRTTLSEDDKASQNFFFLEGIFTFGAIFPLTKKAVRSTETPNP